MCAIRLESKMQEGRFNQGCDVTLLGGGEFSSEEAVFFAANLALGAILFYQGGDILRRQCYFVTPAHVAEAIFSWPALRP